MILSIRSLKKKKKVVIENYVFMSLKKSSKKMQPRDTFHIENNEIVMFQIGCRPYFQDECILMFAGLFLRVLSLFRTIPK